MFCPACSTENDDNAAFCSNCGNDLRAITGAAGGSTPSYVPPGTPPPAAPSYGAGVPSSDPYGPPAYPQTAYAGFWKRVAAWLIDCG